jgi:chromosome segregation ATPase
MIMKTENQELIDKAKELDLDLEDYDNEEDLQEAIDDAEEGADDLDSVKEKLEFQKSEAKKAFDARDKAKNDTRRIRGKLSDQEKTISSMQKKLDAAPDMEKFNEQQAKLDKLIEEADEKAMSKMDDAEKAEVRFNKKMEEFDAKLEASETSFGKKLADTKKELEDSKQEITDLRKVRLGAEIVTEAAKGGAYNPDQVKKILESEFKYDKELETFTSVERNDKGKIVDELTVKETVKKFLDDPDNDNLVKSKAKGGTGSKETGTGSSNAAEETNEGGLEHRLGGKNRKTPNGEYDPKDKGLIEDADDKGLKIEDHIATLKLRDAKMNKIKGISTEDK